MQIVLLRVAVELVQYGPTDSPDGDSMISRFKAWSEGVGVIRR